MSRKAKFRPGPISAAVAPEQKVETVAERNQRLAKDILSRNPEFSEAFAHIVSEVKSVASANMVMMGYELWRVDPTIKFKQKPVGIANGLIVSTSAGDLYVKTFLGGSTSGRSQLVELFAYKLLENLGLGAEIEGMVCDGVLPFLVSKDLRNGDKKVCFGSEARRVLASIFKERDGNFECKSAVIALEILAKILHLGDLSQNEGNYGVVIADDGKVRPVVVDFHFDPLLTTTLSARGSNIKLDGFRKDLQTARRASDAMTVGLTKAAAESEFSCKTSNLI